MQDCVFTFHKGFIGVAESKYELCDRLKLAGAQRPQRH
jgi:hypothetical protein